MVKDFLNSAKAAYLVAGQYMQLKLPLNSPTLQSLSSIDPLAWGHSITVDHLKHLSSNEILGRWVPSDCDIHKEILLYNVDLSLKEAEKNNVVSWWSSLLETGKYPGLCAVACAALSIFHGPMVEASFSAMNDIIDVKSNRLSMLTFDAFQTTKYAIKTTGKSSIAMFRRDDVKNGKVDRRLCKNILSAARRDKVRRKSMQRVKMLRLQRFESKVAPSAAEVTKQLKEKEARWKRKRALALLCSSKRARKTR